MFRGQKRDLEIGILHDDDTRLADAVLALATGFEVQRNQPYGPADSVTHTLRRHALRNNLLNVMIEIRNDLIATPEGCEAMAQTISGWIDQALATLRSSGAGEGRS